MSDHTFLGERAELPSAIKTLPPEVRDKEASGFLAIVLELQRSLLLELRVMASVERVDSQDCAAVRALQLHLKDYKEAREIQKAERSHCDNIERVRKQMKLDDPSDSSVTHVRDLIDRLGGADDRFVKELERAVNMAFDAITAMDKNCPGPGTAAAQEAFRQHIEARKEAVKGYYRDMTDIANRLLDSV